MTYSMTSFKVVVAIHNKNGKGLLLGFDTCITTILSLSQSTIKMEKGYYFLFFFLFKIIYLSQSTIKMEKGYYSSATVVGSL